MFEVMLRGKDGMDSFVQDLGRMLAETIMYIDRENIAWPDYRPFNSKVQKWASQQGSIYVGDQHIADVIKNIEMEQNKMDEMKEVA